MAVSHTYLVHQGMVGMEEGEKMFYDEDKQHMLVARGDTLKAFDFSKMPTGTSSPAWELHIDDVGSCLHLGVSADHKTVAIQRDEKQVEFIDRLTGNIFVEVYKKPHKNVLGFFFVQCQECSFVMVTSTGLELSKFSSDRKGLKLRNKFKQTIRWYIYTFATRMVSIGTGKTGARVQGYQFTWAETVKLPQVDFDAAPFPITPEDLLNASMAGPRQPPPLVTVEDVILLRLYNRIFIGHIDRSRMRLRLYRVFMDTILLAREYELFSPLLAFNVVDNVILLHQRQASVAVLLDVASASSEPIGSPLPLVTVKSPPAQAPSAEDAEASTEKDIKKFTARWKFFLPNIVIDEVGNVYKTQLDLPAVIASSPATYLLVGFLNRRRPGAHSLGDPRGLLLEELRSILRNSTPRETVRKILCSLHKDGSENPASEKDDKSAPVSLALQASVLEPEDMCKEVFSVVLDGRKVDPGYMEGILMDYMDISGIKGVELPVAAYIVMIDVLLLQDKSFQLQQLLAGSSHMQNLQVAEYLESHADLSGSEFIRKLSLDVYSRCGIRSRVQGNQTGCELYCNKLLKAGKVISALRVAHHHQITSLTVSTCLDAARKTGDPCIIRAVERFCSSSR